jgi:protease-4
MSAKYANCKLVASEAANFQHAGVTQAVDRFGLDGMLALWQPAGTN